MNRAAAATLTAGTIVRHTPSGRLYQVQYIGADGAIVVRGTRGPEGSGYNGPAYGVPARDCERAEESLPRIGDLAAAFVRQLRTVLTPAEWIGMCAANRAETSPGVCHSHDYGDANLIMALAWTECAGIKFDPDNDAHCDRWSAAWDAAWPELCGRRDGLNTIGGQR